MAWCVVLVIENILARSLGVRGINNQWVFYTFNPLTTAMVLWALSYWHPESRSRSIFRWSALAVVLVSVMLTFTIEDARTFSLVIGPFHGVTLLVAALWTFVALTFRTEGPLLRQDWFWVTGGLFIHAGTTAATHPLGW